MLNDSTYGKQSVSVGYRKTIALFTSIILFHNITVCENKTDNAINPTQTQKLLVTNGSAASISKILPNISGPSNIDVEKTIFKWFRTFSEAIHLIVKKHYKTIDIPSFIQDALKAALPKTDPHSSFFSQKSYRDAIESTSGKFSGIGVSIMNKAPEDDSLVVIDVIQGGPSDKAGLLPGDQIVGVDGESLKGLSSDEVIMKLRGTIGTNVNLKILREKKPLEMNIKREIIKDQNLLCYHFKKQNIYYISLKMFADNTHKQMSKYIDIARKNKSNGLIIDLRRNPGGVLDSAVNTVGLFVKKGSLVVSTKNKAGNTMNSYHTTTKPRYRQKKPVFILTDNFTASASEIFAGCLKHYSNKNYRNLSVVLVGTETFGKGSVQEVIPISNGCALKLTTMTYELPDDVPIQAKGIMPDIIINPKFTPEKETLWVQNLYGKESVLRNHIPAKGSPQESAAISKAKQPETKAEIAKNWESRFRKALSTDVQIQGCIDMINTINLAKANIPKAVKTRQETINFLKQNYLTDEESELSRVK